MPLDVEKTSYHETGGKIWRIDSGTDYGDVWDLDVFEQHGEDYLKEDQYEENIVRDAKGDLEKLEVDFDNRGYKLFRDEETEDFWFMFYMEPESDIDNLEPYIDRVWFNEIDTILSETARSKMVLRHELEDSDDTYRNRLSRKI